MNNPLWRQNVAVCGLLLTNLVGLPVAVADEVPNPRMDQPRAEAPQALTEAPPADKETPIRELFIPFEDLGPVLTGSPQRVFVTRQRYAELLAQAEEQPKPEVPHAVVLLNSRYRAEVGEDRAVVQATLEMEVLREGVLAVPLRLGGVGIRRAELDGRPAALADRGGGQVHLFVSGVGRHTLQFELVTQVTSSVAEQSLAFDLPRGATNRFELTVPGDVEIKSGADVAQRNVDVDRGQTHFRLLLPAGATNLTMSLNNRRLAEDRVVVARSVLVDELTEAYERLHATVSLEVLHGAAETFRLALPSGFEVTQVSSPLVSRWEVVPGDPPTLSIALREPLTDTAVLAVTAVRGPKSLDDWRFPRLLPLEVAGQVSVLGLLLEDRLRPARMQSAGLVAIDADVVDDVLPTFDLERPSGAAPMSVIAAYYAPQADYQWTASLEKPPARLWATTNVLLTLTDTQLEARGGFALLPLAERIFQCDILVPAGWHVDELTYGQQQQPLAFERYEAADGRSRLHLQLPAGVDPGTTYQILFHAVSTPPGWLDPWPEARMEIEFPVFRVADTARDIGALAVQPQDDLAVAPGQTAGLLTLDSSGKEKFGLGGVPATLAYRYESHPYRLPLIVRRIEPRVTCRVMSFLKISPDHLTGHYELIYDISDARTNQLQFELPASTPAEVGIRSLDGVAVKSHSSKTIEDARRWQVQLAERRAGTVRLAVDFEMPRDQQEVREAALPLARAAGVAHQTGVIAVEGDAELEVEVAAHPRKVDVGELVDAEYQPGKRLLGVFAYVGDDTSVKVHTQRHTPSGLPIALVQQVELVTVLSSAGSSQTAARFRLRTKAPFLQFRLPSEATLWSVLVDGQAAKPQREDASLLVSLPPDGNKGLRELRLFYELPVRNLHLWSDVRVPAPELSLRSGQGFAALPTADLQWNLYLPSGYRLIKSHGTVYTDQIDRHSLGDVLAARAAGYAPAIGAQAARHPDRTSAASRTSDRADAPKTEADADFESGFDDEMSKSETTPAGSEDPFGDRRRAAQPKAQLVPDAAEALPAEEPAPAQPSAPANMPAGVPTGPPATPPGSGPTKKSAASYWALQGLRSLKIDFQTEGDEVTFRSLGAAPQLGVRLIDRRRTNKLAWAASLSIALYGLLLLPRPAASKTRFVVACLLVATVFPLATGWGDELGYTFEAVGYTALVLIPLYIAAALAATLFRAVAKPLRRLAVWLSASRAVSTAVGLTLACAASVQPAFAQSAPGPLDSEAWKQFGIQIVPPVRPILVPADAIVVPYDPDDPQGVAKAERLLIPYPRYVALLKRAEQGEPEPPAPPASFATGGAELAATLADVDALEIEGRLWIDVYGKNAVAVALPFSGGVLSQASVDDQPAQVEIVPSQPARSVPNAPAQQGAAPPQRKAQLVVYLSGRGRHELNFTVRYPVTRRGGWRRVDGTVPVAPATSFVLHVPKARTEVRLGGLADRAEHETTADGQTIASALHPDGQLDLQWRPKVGAAVVDRGLTSDSQAVLDVQEDGMRLLWRLDLNFRNGQREEFQVLPPAGWLVENVRGDNVRGWEIRGDEQQPRLSVSLLRPAQKEAQFDVSLSRRETFLDQETTFRAPAVRAEGAALERGTIYVRRSPLLELRTISTTGLQRINLEQAEGAARLAKESASPLGIRPHQAYRFVSAGFDLQLEARPVKADVTARLRTLLRVALRDRRLESQVTLQTQRRPVYRLRIAVPAGLNLDKPEAPGEFRWATRAEAGRQIVELFFADGRRGTFPVVLRGVLDSGGMAQRVALPQVEVLDVNRQQGAIAVQVDPALEAQADELTGLRAVALSQVAAWLQPQQRSNVQLALTYTSAPYSGSLRVTQRQPRVTCRAVTNIRVTARMLQETILLDYKITEAGNSEYAFLVPERMRTARIRVPMLREKTIEDAGDGKVRVKLVLQDTVQGSVRVLVENDRLPENDAFAAPIPRIEGARTEARFVTLESSGRDEIVVERSAGVEPLSRQQMAWRELAELLPGNITQAFLVNAGTADPELAFQPRRRSAVDTAGARIGLAETRMVVDTAGAYRAEQLYHVDNRTEQYLDVRLPEGARLWTAQVAGEAVKPAAVDRSPDQARIPLVKTAPGDQDFRVSLKYGGLLGELGTVGDVRFPLLETVNIRVEQSQVRLWLPEKMRWFDFGGTMGRVQDEGSLKAGYLAYKNRQLQELVETYSSDNPFASLRAKSNIQKLEQQLQQETQRTSRGLHNEELTKQLRENERVLEEAQQQIADEQDAVPAGEVLNRAQLESAYRGQRNFRADNVVNDLEYNFQAPGALEATDRDADGFDRNWLNKNQLDRGGKLPPASGERPESRRRDGAKPGQASGKATKRPRDVPNQPTAAKAFEQAKKRANQAQQKDLVPAPQNRQHDQLQRYAEQLEEQQGSQAQQARNGREREASAQPGGQAQGGELADLPPPREESEQSEAAGRQQTLAFGGSSAAPAAQGPMASLEVEIPQRGSQYLFTTPGGKLEITTRYVSRPLQSRMERLLWVAGIAVIGIVLWQWRKGRRAETSSH